MNKLDLYYRVMSLDKGLTWKDKSDSIIEKAIEIIQRYGLKTNSRESGLVFKRQALFYYLYENSALSTTRIGKLFGKDHATVLYGIKAFISAKKTYDEKFNREIRYFEDEIILSFQAKRYIPKTKRK